MDQVYINNDLIRLPEIEKFNISLDSETEKFNISLDWDTLYNFQKTFRNENAISGSSLLRYLNLSPNCLQYLYSKKVYPSKTKGSIGLELRDALELLKNSPSLKDSFTDDSSLSEKVTDIIMCEDNRKKLKEAHIFDIIVSCENSESVKVICLGKYNEEKIKETLQELKPLLKLNIKEYEIIYYF